MNFCIEISRDEVSHVEEKELFGDSEPDAVLSGDPGGWSDDILGRLMDWENGARQKE